MWIEFGFWGMIACVIFAWGNNLEQRVRTHQQIEDMDIG